MRQRSTALKRRNHLGTHKCQNPISAPLVQDKSYTVRRGLHMFPWGSSGSHYGNERGQITRYRSLGKAGTKSRRSILWIGALNKRGLNPAPLPPPTSNKLLQRVEQPENSISSHLCQLVSPNYTVLLFRRSEITALPLLFHRPRISHMSRPPKCGGRAASPPVWSRVGALSSSLHLGKVQELIPSALRVTGAAEGYGGRQFVCVSQWVSIPSERMLHHCRYRSLQTISQMLIEVINAAASRGNRCRW